MGVSVSATFAALVPFLITCLLPFNRIGQQKLKFLFAFVTLYLWVSLPSLPNPSTLVIRSLFEKPIANLISLRSFGV